MMTAEADIRYRGIFTYRGLRFIALFAMSISQIALILSALQKFVYYLSPEQVTSGNVLLLNICIILGNLTFPLFIVASFSTIFSRPESVVRALIENVVLALITFVFCAFFIEGIISSCIEQLPAGIIEQMDIEKLLDLVGNHPQLIGMFGIDMSSENGIMISELVPLATEMLKEIGIESLIIEYLPMISGAVTKYIIINFVNINVYWDLSLCTLFYFFLTYKPKKLQAGKLMLFRCCAVLPASFVLCSTFITGLLKKGIVDLPVWGIAMLTNKKLPLYILFGPIVTLLKYKEINYLAAGGTYKDYLEKMKTKRNSLQFSLYLSLFIAVISLFEFALSRIEGLSAWGIGSSYYMFIAIPFILLFSYNKKPKHKWPSVLIPVYYVVYYVALVMVVIGFWAMLPQVLEVLINR